MIEFKNVSKTYDNGTKALKDVSLKINKGEFVFVVGASGAGKSTFLKLIMHEEVPNSGTIIVNNQNLITMRKKEIPYFRRTMGIVFQDFRLIPNMTVYDNVAFAMRVIGAYEKDIRKRVPYVLGLVGLNTKARNMPNQLSRGEHQRVALARALVNNAGLIIADEPTGNVDPEMSFEIVDLLNHINANGTTVVMVTHEHELVRSFKHRVVVINNGTVTSDTGPEDLSTREANRRAMSRQGRSTAYYHADEGRARREKDFIQTYEPSSAVHASTRKKASGGESKPSGEKHGSALDISAGKRPEKAPEQKAVPAENNKKSERAPERPADKPADPIRTGTVSAAFARDDEDNIDYSIYLEHLSELGGDQDEK